MEAYMERGAFRAVKLFNTILLECIHDMHICQNAQKAHLKSELKCKPGTPVTSHGSVLAHQRGYDTAPGQDVNKRSKQAGKGKTLRISC